ncbi:SWR1-complex protein 4 [Diutina catenulata]
MSANDVLDVLNISREDTPKPQKKRQKVASEASKQTGMARELYSLLGPNTPPVALTQNTKNMFSKDKIKMKASPWTRMPFKVGGNTFHHWVKGSKQLLEQEADSKEYFFDKFNVKVDIPELCDEETYNRYVEELNSELKQAAEAAAEAAAPKEDEPTVKEEENGTTEEKNGSKDEKNGDKNDDKENRRKRSRDDDSKKRSATEMEQEEVEIPTVDFDYAETQYLWELCRAFELKWPIIYDRYDWPSSDRVLEDLKQHFYRVCIKILEADAPEGDDVGSSTTLVQSLRAFDRTREVERKKYLENLLKRTPAEIAEEESLVIEARRFEMAAKKMLSERTNLLALLDSPQATQQVAQYQSSTGLANLYNNLMIYDKHQKNKKSIPNSSKPPSNPVPPAIPPVAASSMRRDRSFQTHLQQYLASFLKQSGPQATAQGNAIKQLLQKRLTQAEEEAYGLHYHSQEKMTPGVTLRSAQRLPSVQQKQSTLKSVQMLLQELDIPTGGGTTWRPVMPTRKTMAKYEELIRAVVTLLDVKKGKDKMEAEIRLVKSQRGGQ